MRLKTVRVPPPVITPALGHFSECRVPSVISQSCHSPPLLPPPAACRPWGPRSRWSGCKPAVASSFHPAADKNGRSLS